MPAQAYGAWWEVVERGSSYAAPLLWIGFQQVLAAHGSPPRGCSPALAARTRPRGRAPPVIMPPQRWTAAPLGTCCGLIARLSRSGGMEIVQVLCGCPAEDHAWGGHPFPRCRDPSLTATYFSVRLFHSLDLRDRERRLPACATSSPCRDHMGLQGGVDRAAQSQYNHAFPPSEDPTCGNWTRAAKGRRWSATTTAWGGPTIRRRRRGIRRTRRAGQTAAVARPICAAPAVMVCPRLRRRLARSQER